MKNTLVSTKNFVVRNKTALLVATAAIAVIAIQQKGMKQHNDFLKEHNLYDSFYASEEI